MREETLEGQGRTRTAALPGLEADAGRDSGVPTPLRGRLGLDVPQGWWPSAPLLKAHEAAGFGWAQVHSPPPAVLATPRLCTAHAASLAASLETTGLRTIVHGPSGLRVGSKGADRVFEGLLSWAAEIGARHVVYHARNLPDAATSESAQLFETRSLARLARRAERLEVGIAVENLCPVFPGPEWLSANPMTPRGLVRRIGSDYLGVCLDVGHANVVADLRHTTVDLLIEPVLDVTTVFHLHDNLGARRRAADARWAGIDPLRLDLHLPPGRGKLPWSRIASLLAGHRAPLMLEIQPPYRGRSADLFRAAVDRLA